MKNAVLGATLLAASFMFAPTQSFAASLVANVSIGSQTMTVSENGRVVAKWKVSTARDGYITPRGQWSAKRKHTMWYSRKYDMSPMPYAVFYNGGYAVHGTGSVKALGRPASHGCVRLATGNAKAFYNLVSRHGMSNTRIVVR